jgi:signal transduction histidine kinase
VHRVEDVTELVREGEVLRGEAARLKQEVMVRARLLALTNAGLQTALEHRRRLTAVVGHDLRSPLSTIRMGVDLLSAHFTKLGAVPPKTIDTLRSAVLRMEHLLDDLNDYTVSQFEGTLRLSREWVNLRDVCQDVVRATQVARPDRVIEMEPGENIGTYVDPKRKRQVLANLINNALDHGAKDRPVRVALRRVTGGCVILVSNEGIPIPREMVPSLFEPFRRGANGESANPRGHMGLGLYIVNQIVQAHEGRIDVESTPRGTHFTVFIPIG